MKISEEEYLILLRKRDLADEMLDLIKRASAKLEECKGLRSGIVDILMACDDVIAKAYNLTKEQK